MAKHSRKRNHERESKVSREARSRSRSEESRRQNRRRSRSSKERRVRREASRSTERRRRDERSASGNGWRRSESRDGRGQASYLAKLTAALTDAIRIGSSRARRLANERALPEFDPEARSVSASEWVRKMDEFSKVFEWSDADKVCVATIKLQGTARKWYDGLRDSPLTWDDLSRAIVREFGGEENFGKLLEDAALYRSTPGESLVAYCWEKVARVKRLGLDVPERKLVECVVHGIHDEAIRTSLTAASKESVGDVARCLESLGKVGEGRKRVCCRCGLEG